MSKTQSQIDSENRIAQARATLLGETYQPSTQVSSSTPTDSQKASLDRLRRMAEAQRLSQPISDTEKETLCLKARENVNDQILLMEAKGRLTRTNGEYTLDGKPAPTLYMELIQTETSKVLAEAENARKDQLNSLGL